MTALKGRDIAAFLASRRPDAVVALVYGPDLGLVRERAAQLGRQVVADLNDPFNAIDLGDADVDPPGRLVDEAAALSFMGGARLIRLRTGSEKLAAALGGLLRAVSDGSLKPNAFVVVEAGDLRKTSALRKLCEASPHAVALPCYAEEGRDLAARVRAQLAEDGLDIAEDALSLLVERLGEDRGVTRSEVEKLALYMGPKDVRPPGRLVIGLADVRAGLAESAADATFEVIDAMLDGEVAGLSAALARGAQAGMSPLGVLRIAQGRLQRVLRLAEAVAAGAGTAEAIRALRPPPNFIEERRLQGQIRRWPLSSVSAALAELFETELAAKRTVAPQRMLVERVLLRQGLRAARGRA